MLGIYDKSRSNTRFIRNVQRYTKQETKVCSELQNLQNCKIAIAHIFKEEWDSLISKYSPCCSVRIRVSTAGFPHTPSPAKSNNGVYKFHLVSSTDHLEESGWNEILRGLSDRTTVAALVRGENPNGLRRFFVHEVQEHLAALTILCEGYLALHAETEKDNINSALQLMKWAEFQESERGQKVIQSVLNKRMDTVQQPKWWLRVFEQESFCEDVKKEWKNTTGEEEIPLALNNLLELIQNNKSVTPSKIVAAAYCVLRKKEIGTKISEWQIWQIRHKKFNHTWLQKFLRSFNDFIDQLQKSNPDCVRMSEFLAEDFPAWKSKRHDAQWIIQSFEDSMSPQQLLDSDPLNLCDIETREWLGYLIHELWLFRHAVREKSKESQEALVEVNEMYETMASELDQSMPNGLQRFIALQESYRTLSKTLSNLSRDES